MITNALHGKVAFITGAGSGLGAAFARRLAADGATVVVNDLSQETAQAVANEVGGSTAVFDVCDSAAFDAGIDATVARYGSLDIMIKVHLYGTFYGVRAALRHMQTQRNGVVVNISSILGQLPAGGPPHYSAAKAAIIALTKSAAAETAHLGIRVNAVCPGYIDTPLLDDLSDMMRMAVTSRLGMGRMGTADELAELVRFLSGPESSYATGDVFTMSGGYVG